MIESIRIDDWLILMKEKFLRIKDIKNLETGDQIKFLCIDRNFYDLIEHNMDKYTRPEVFFKHNYVMNYIHRKHLDGYMYFRNDNNDVHDFEFHVNWRNKWYPLENGYLSDEGRRFLGLDAPVTLDEYQSDTLVGWRGPVLLWKDVIDNSYLLRN
tara:strand:+ start:100 stop:564 length:465 start_codon:yes stop_codon:yes gene_type:complete